MTVIPQYHEKRLNLHRLDQMFLEYIGGPEVVDIGETIRLMLADFFYGEVPPSNRVCFTLFDRIIAFPPGVVSPPVEQRVLEEGADLMGEIFWAMADEITHRALAVTPEYSHRPNECFYRFFPEKRELVVYTPVLAGLVYPPGFAALEGRAVIITCAETLPSWLKG